MANAAALSQRHSVVAVDVDPRRVDMVNAYQSPIVDVELEAYLATKPTTLVATQSLKEAVEGADVMLVATPTDYDPETNYFDTSSVESVVAEALESAPGLVVIIKSTVPVGFTGSLAEAFPGACIVFSPEFLREGRAFYDCIHPSRIVVGDRGDVGASVGEMLASVTVDGDAPVLQTGPTEAEAIKLFSNTYLALRVSFFNELDTFAATFGLDTRQIIDGVSLDPRIGSHYNNPSFGYGGYCLPKDTKQLLANYSRVPQNLISAVVDANRTRKEFIVDQILERKPSVVGIFRLAMKLGSDNYRSSSIQGIVSRLQARGVPVILYEPSVEEDAFNGVEVVNELAEFKRRADVIIANRHSAELEDVSERVYSRDVFQRD
ncbi:nucleotide sugar dehydrogenase [Tessaracoccus lacteus]|uniref:UDP-glucose 6-dehydrogenase n=1 Tax=Tessaracoccus lacteus TaxID=3041766 RepID=A0ABY8Q1M5_9ACTN|nr:nucleotide sugar dehydrogenase [Tessaracoccus sp. T21]WGT48589.1 nucleotide sugar dehydrogenase [Tessaracoccus sp. T21]